MADANFTWWPWRIMALALPVLAGGSALMSMSQGRKPVESIQIFFVVIAAGNAYLFATAIGDFGKSMIAIPVGAASAMAGVHLFAYPLANTVFLIVMGSLMFIQAYRRDALGLVSGSVLILVGFLFGAIRRPEPELCIVCTYPFVCGCVTGSMPIESTPSEIASACAAGFLASLRGMLWGLFAVFGLMFLFALISPLLIFLGTLWQDYDFVPALLGGLLVMNYSCVKSIFSSIQRVEPEALKATEGGGDPTLSETEDRSENETPTSAP